MDGMEMTGVKAKRFSNERKGKERRGNPLRERVYWPLSLSFIFPLPIKRALEYFVRSELYTPYVHVLFYSCLIGGTLAFIFPFLFIFSVYKPSASPPSLSFHSSRFLKASTCKRKEDKESEELGKKKKKRELFSPPSYLHRESL